MRITLPLARVLCTPLLTTSFLEICSKLSVSELPRLMDNIKAGIQPFGMFRISAIFSELNKVKESPSQTAAALEGFFRYVRAFIP